MAKHECITKYPWFWVTYSDLTPHLPHLQRISDGEVWKHKHNTWLIATMNVFEVEHFKEVDNIDNLFFPSNRGEPNVRVVDRSWTSILQPLQVW